VNFFANSIAYDMFLDPFSINDIEATVARMKQFCIALNINKYFSLQTNFLKAESVITRGLDLALVKPAFYMFDFLMEKNAHKDLWEILLQDLPQFLSQDKININQFFDIQYNELFPSETDIMATYKDRDNNKDDQMKQSNKVRYCNLELPLVNKSLPVLGAQKNKHFKLNIDNFANTIAQANLALIDD